MAATYRPPPHPAQHPKLDAVNIEPPPTNTGKRNDNFSRERREKGGGEEENFEEYLS